MVSAIESASQPETLSAGRRWAEEGRVRLLDLGPDLARAEVTGTDDATHPVTLELNESPASTCSCASWGSREDHCKHVAALAFALETRVRGERAARTPFPRPPPRPLEQPAPKAPADVEPLRDWLGLPETAHAFTYDLDLKGGLAIGVLRADREKQDGLTRFAQVAPYLRGHTLEPADRRVLSMLAGLPRDPEGRYHAPAWGAGTLLEALRHLPITVDGKRAVFSEFPAHLFGELGLTEASRSVTVRLRLADGTLVALDAVRLASAMPVYVQHGSLLHRLETAAPLEQLERWKSEPTFRLPRDAGAHLDYALSGLLRQGVVLDDAAEAQPVPPAFSLTVDGDAEHVQAFLAVRYGEIELPLSGAASPTHVTADGRLLRRDVGAEAAALEAVLEAGLGRGPGGGFAARGDKAVDFWTRGLGTLPEDWTLFGPKPRDVVKVRRLAPRVLLTRASGGWFNLEVAFAQDDQSIDLARLRPLLASGRRYVKLADGTVGELPREICEQIRGLLDETGAEPEGSAVKLAAYEAGEVERLIELVPDARVDTDVRQFLVALRDFRGIEEVPVPAGLKADLRPYQRRGLDWLSFLHQSGMSGVLADDMGLGKTVQALALLLRLKKEEGRGLSLVVAPTSVLPNWQRETERFAPELKVLLYDGPDREKLLAEAAKSDVMLTSYALLRRDVEELRKLKLRYLILDEAQHVKNPSSQGAKAARSLHAEHKLALTGTPLENRLADLWSLFHFLMPGFLGSESQFRSRYARPIEVDGSSAARDRLKRRVHPFILRRLKDEVARDLPPRTDTVLPVDLSAGQQALYREMLLTAKGRVETIIEKMGFKKARISILTELLRLRQVCCDPRLLKLPPGTRLPPSTKLEAFAELVRDMMEEGHRALVFSQFTEMLGHLVAWAEEEGLRYEYLDGETKDRQARIDRFNAQDGPPLFFISLKAGGFGLNLTGADYVIHFDPWWNPAVEQQAIDRAHRIGQTKPVFSYKLIAKGTVEEKMLAMQARKKSLAAGVLSEDDALGKVLTEKDVAELFAV